MTNLTYEYQKLLLVFARVHVGLMNAIPKAPFGICQKLLLVITAETAGGLGVSAKDNSKNRYIHISPSINEKSADALFAPSAQFSGRELWEEL